MNRARMPVVVGVVAGLLACASPDPNARSKLSLPPGDTATFKPVGDFVAHRCGSLDCHGQVGRNFKVYGGDSLRLVTANNPQPITGNGDADTQPEEYASTYASLVDLEPEIISDVVKSGGSSPDRLTFVRKMRGDEQHIGGKLVSAGDDMDTCMTSWLSGNVDTDACAKAEEAVGDLKFGR